MVIGLAGQRIGIDNLYPYIEEYCKEYRIKEDDGVSLSIHVTKEDIAYERDKSEREDRAEGIPVRQFSDDYLETLAVYRKIAEWMPAHDTVLFHGSVVAVDGKGYLFTAKSGTGKSTHTRLWMEHFGDRAVMVNDDKPLLKVGDGKVTACGTPWDGKHRLSRNISVPLGGICVLHRAEDNRIEKADRQEVYPMFVQQIYRPADKGSMARTFSLIDKILENVPVYHLYCNMDISAAKVAYDGMNGGAAEEKQKG